MYEEREQRESQPPKSDAARDKETRYDLTREELPPLDKESADKLDDTVDQEIEKPKAESVEKVQEAKSRGPSKFAKFMAKLRLAAVSKFPNLYPPFWGAGIKVEKISKDFSKIDVKMKLSVINKNYNGTHYGGSLFSMTDPFYAMILIKNLGPGYVVWDKEATIKFKRPGKTTVRASFEISQDRIKEIKEAADRDGKIEPRFQAEIRDEHGNVVAEVDKVVYVRKKEPKTQ